MTSTASKKPDLKVASEAAVEPVVAKRHVPQRTGNLPAQPAPSIAARMTRGFFQLLLPVLVVAGGVAGYKYLQATKPEAPKRQAKPSVFAIKTVPVQFGTVQPQLRLFGNTVAGRQVEIRSLVAGQVVTTSDRLRDGGKIAAGATILTIDPFNFNADLQENEAQSAEAVARVEELKASLTVERGNLKFAREQAELAKTDLTRAKNLVQRGAVTERVVDDRRLILNQRRQAVTQMENNIRVWEARVTQQEAAIKRLETARRRAAQRLAETKLVAPFNAYVTDVGAQVGRMVSVNDRVATLIDRDWIEVAFTVTDRQFGRLARGAGGIEGRVVEVRWNVGESPLVYAAKIDRVGANVSSEAGGVQLFARVDEPAEGVGLRPGAFVEVRVPDTEFSEVASLPSTAVFNGTTVFIVKDGKLAARDVNIVSTSGSNVLVRGALEAGDNVMITRLSLPGDGVRVNDLGAEQTNRAAATAGGKSDGQ
ncbi:MAG: efflux RND transporter periplasmic adaptor subunit [Hyphomicrobiaceae bacterium]